MTVKLDKPIFYYGPGDVTDPVFASSSLAMDLPATPSLRSIASVGGDIDGDSGIRVAYVVRNDELISLTLRFFETQWPDVVALLDSVMEGQLFMFFPVATDPTFELVRLESPRPGAKYEAQPDPQYPRALTLPLVLRISDVLDAPTFGPPYDLYQYLLGYPTVAIVGGKLHVGSYSNGGSNPRGVWWPIPDEDQLWETKCSMLLVENLWNEQIHMMIGRETGSGEEGLCYGPGHSYSGPGGSFDKRMHLWSFVGIGTMLYRGGTDLADFSMWLRIERVGDALKFYHSENHTAWTLDVTKSIAADMSGIPNRIGLGAINHVANTGISTTGIFDYLARIS